MNDSGAATACDRKPPSASSRMFASAISPRKPMPIEVSVMPSWQADRYSAMLSSWCRASRAPRAPRPPASTRASSFWRWARTSPNSAATKNPFSRTSTRTARVARSAVIGDALSEAVRRRGNGRRQACYFARGRRRSCADVATVAGDPGGQIGPPEGRSGRGADRPRELEVVPGQPALGVCRDLHLDLAPGELEVGVVVHLLGGRRDRVDEVHGAREVAAVELLDDGVAVPAPAVAIGKRLLDLLIRQTCHPHLSVCASRASSPPQPRCCSRSASGEA